MSVEKFIKVNKFRIKISDVIRYYPDQDFSWFTINIAYYRDTKLPNTANEINEMFDTEEERDDRLKELDEIFLHS